MNSCSQMDKHQIASLAMAICATAEVMGQAVTANAARLMAEDLSIYPPVAVSEALKAVRREVTGKLTLGTILQRVQVTDGRPGRDEAWGIALASTDEYDTVVMTDEIQLALSAARPVLDSGDKIGAKFAFNSAYDRIVLQARAEGRPVKWNVSIGFDAGRRVVAVNAAVLMLRIAPERGQLLLADLTHEPITADGQAIAGLLAGPEGKKASPGVREKLQAIREQVKEMNEANEARRLEMKIEAAEALAARLALLTQQAQPRHETSQSVRVD